MTNPDTILFPPRSYINVSFSTTKERCVTKKVCVKDGTRKEVFLAVMKKWRSLVVRSEMARVKLGDSGYFYYLDPNKYTTKSGETVFCIVG